MAGKRKKRNIEEQALFELDKEITTQLKKLLPDVLERSGKILNSPITSVASLHGKIGGKNNDYANVADMRFHDCREFQCYWAMGMSDTYRKSMYDCAVWDVLKLYKDDVCREYILLFQERNFYRHYMERIRTKPENQFWEIWFGGNLNLGLFIAPARLPDGRWRIDHSEIRKVSYQYWTIGHILSVGGVINPMNNYDMYPMRNLADIEIFYQNIITSLSNSQYEREICQRYVSYLKQSSDFMNEPFLIPEFHYEGAGKRCKYRMDFTVLNPHTFEFVSFELSPSSSHFHIDKTKYKTQKELNTDISTIWKYEFDKRNRYLSKFGMSCYTFTDEQLQNPDECFNVIATYLRRRGTNIPSYDDVVNYIHSINI